MTGLPRIFESLPDPYLRLHDGTEPADDHGLDELARRLGYAFARPALLRVALTLGSWANEHAAAGWPSNASLEFFGDAVLGLVAADALWQRFPELAEGELTRLRALLVSERSLASAAETLELGQFLYLGRGDLKRGGREHASTLADTVEAVLGAVFLDARADGRKPLRAAAEVFARVFGERLRAIEPESGLDPKSRLQHWAQARHRITPSYVRVGDKPPPSDPRWRARVELHFPDGRVEILGEGEGRNLKLAEREAALAALEHIDED